MRTLISKVMLDDEIKDILIENGKILKIEDNINDDVQEIIVGEGLIALPSFVDMHFHLRNPGLEYKQTYEEANAACLKGGYAYVLAMANTLPVADCNEVIAEVKDATCDMPVTFKQIASISTGLLGESVVDFKRLREYTNVFSDDGKNVDNEEVMKLALEASKELDFIILDHDEPETEMVIRNLKLVEETGGRLHFCHISKKASMEAIIEGKRKGLPITVEVTPHHIFSSNLSYRVNPPIATQEDRLFLIEAIKAGYVDCIGTDHAPHSDDDKANGAPGIINIENAFAMVWKVFKENGIDLKVLSELMCINPCKLLGIDGGIEVGKEANIVLFRDEATVVSKDNFVTRSKNTPYDGWSVQGIIEKTIVGGVCSYDNGQA